MSAASMASMTAGSVTGAAIASPLGTARSPQRSRPEDRAGLGLGASSGSSQYGIEQAFDKRVVHQRLDPAWTTGEEP